MTIFGVSESVFRFGSFIGVLALMVALETWLPRRERREKRSTRWRTNFAILLADFASVSVVTLLVPVTAVLAAYFAQSRGWGLFNVLGWPAWIEFVLAFIVLDFVIWGQHLATHKIPLLWRVHRVHHTDHDLDASSAVRFHPLEILLSVGVKAAAVVILGAPVLAVIVFEAVVNAAALFNHANLRLPLWLDRVLRVVVVTPDMHRVHHSVHHTETDSNYGFALSIWDKIFATYVAQPKDGHEQMVLGLNEWQDERPTRLGWSLALPFRGAVSKTPPGTSADTTRQARRSP